MATKEQIEQALGVARERAAAGDAKAQGYIGILEKELSSMADPTFADKAKAVGTSALAGLNDPFLGASQLLARGGHAASSSLLGDDNPVTDFFESEKNLYDTEITNANSEVKSARDRAGFDGFDVSRLATNIANPVNALPALSVASKVQKGGSALALAGAGARAGAVGGAALPVANTDSFATEKLGQIAIGAAAGGAAAPAVRSIARHLSSGINRARMMVNKPDAGEMVDEALQAANIDPSTIGARQYSSMQARIKDALRRGEALDPAELARDADFQLVNVNPTKGQLSRDPTQFTFERNSRGVEGVGDDLRAHFVDQSRQLHSQVDDLATDAAEPYLAGKRVIGELSAVDRRLRDDIGRLYDDARANPDAGSEINPTGLASEAGRIMDDFRDSVPSGIRRRLAEYGLIGNGQQQTKIFNAKEAEDLLKLANTFRDSPSQTAAMTQLKTAIKRSITEGLGDGGPFEAGRQAAAQRFALHDALPALEKVVDGTASPDKFINKYVKLADRDQVHELANLLTPETKNQVKAQIGEFLRSSAFKADASGDKEFAVQSFASELGRFGRGKLSAFFSSDEIENLYAISRVAGHINVPPATSTVNTSNTGSALANLSRTTDVASQHAPLIKGLRGTVDAVKLDRQVQDALNPSISRLPSTTPGNDRLIELLSTGAAQSGRGILGGQQTP